MRSTLLSPGMGADVGAVFAGVAFYVDAMARGRAAGWTGVGELVGGPTSFLKDFGSGGSVDGDFGDTGAFAAFASQTREAVDGNPPAAVSIRRIGCRDLGDHAILEHLISVERQAGDFDVRH